MLHNSKFRIQRKNLVTQYNTVFYCVGVQNKNCAVILKQITINKSIWKCHNKEFMQDI